MQQDTRRLTVARDHLQAAYDEITRSIGLTEHSMAQQAAQRGLDELDLVVGRLTDEANFPRARDAGDPAQRALSACRHAWQCLHDALNDWNVSAATALPDARGSVQQALQIIDEACLVRRAA